jgi:PAS domain S-box-containing protein
MRFIPVMSKFASRLGFTVTAIDATTAPENLDQSQLSGMITSAMDAIVTVNERREIIVFNPAAEKMFGYASADILGCTLDQLLPMRFRAAHAGQMDGFGTSGAAARRMGSLGSIAACRADGSEFPAEASISQFKVESHAYYTAIIRDVSERTQIIAELRASEERERRHARETRNILFAVPAAVCIAHDPALGNITENDLHKTWFGADSIPHADTPHPFRDVLQRAALGAEVRNVRFSDLNGDGTVRHLLGNAMPVWDDEMVATGAICAFVDVTELKASELKLLAATAGSTAKSDYITQMTHELRTPLGTMLGYAQLMDTSKPALAAPHALAVKQILKAGWHLRDLIDEVQQLATIDAQSHKPTREQVALGVLLEDIGAMITPLLLKKRLVAEFSCIGRVDILGNPQHCRQVLLNLLSNAIKYNRDGGSIHVTCTATSAGMVCVTVRDTGIGLNTAQLAGLFQPFNRLGQEAGAEIGTGVGLVITKRLVEAMGGTIGVDSISGVGTTFRIMLPGADQV